VSEARKLAKAPTAKIEGQPVKTDQEWQDDDFVKQSDALARG
jgi:hypothetical protein